MLDFQYAATKLIEMASSAQLSTDPFDPHLLSFQGGEGTFMMALLQDRRVDPKADKGAPDYLPPFDPTNPLPDVRVSGIPLALSLAAMPNSLVICYSGLPIAGAQIHLTKPISDSLTITPNALKEM